MALAGVGPERGEVIGTVKNFEVVDVRTGGGGAGLGDGRDGERDHAARSRSRNGILMSDVHTHRNEDVSIPRIRYPIGGHCSRARVLALCLLLYNDVSISMCMHGGELVDSAAESWTCYCIH